MRSARIYVFGDSLVAGTYDTHGGWCDRLKQDMHMITCQSEDGTKYQMYNLGIGGETSKGLAARIEAELLARHRDEWPPVILIGTGKNDSRLVEGKPEVQIQEYEDNLSAIVSTARHFTDKIVLIGIGPCADEVINFKKYQYSLVRLLDYDQAMTKVANANDVAKVELYDVLRRAGADVHYRDKLHLSDKGYEIVYQTVRPVLLSILQS